MPPAVTTSSPLTLWRWRRTPAAAAPCWRQFWTSTACLCGCCRRLAAWFAWVPARCASCCMLACWRGLHGRAACCASKKNSTGTGAERAPHGVAIHAAVQHAPQPLSPPPPSPTIPISSPPLPSPPLPFPVLLSCLQPRAVRLGGFQVPREAYALAWAARGTYVATGGEGGLLSLYSVHPEAPARCPMGSTWARVWEAHQHACACAEGVGICAAAARDTLFARGPQRVSALRCAAGPPSASPGAGRCCLQGASPPWTGSTSFSRPC